MICAIAYNHDVAYFAAMILILKGRFSEISMGMLDV
jgi:hypothetical protein